MYRVMALSGLSDSSQSSWATMAADRESFTSPLRHTIRSYTDRIRYCRRIETVRNSIWYVLAKASRIYPLGNFVSEAHPRLELYTYRFANHLPT